MGLKRFEGRLERLVEGSLSRPFRSTLQPVEIGRRLTREMDLQRRVGPRGLLVAPNSFTITLSPDRRRALLLATSTPWSRSWRSAGSGARRDRAVHACSARSRSTSSRGQRLKAGHVEVSARGRRGRASPASWCCRRPALLDRGRTPGHRPAPRVRRRPERSQRLEAPRRAPPAGRRRGPRRTSGSTNGTKVNGAHRLDRGAQRRRRDHHRRHTAWPSRPPRCRARGGPAGDQLPGDHPTAAVVRRHPDLPLLPTRHPCGLRRDPPGGRRRKRERRQGGRSGSGPRDHRAPGAGRRALRRRAPAGR